MEHTSTASIKAARGLLAALFVLSVYRAVTQAVTPGEAWNYNRYIGTGWTEAFSMFDVNNHVLNTLLGKILTAHLHVTELWLRLPSLVCGVLYFWAVWRLARRFGAGLMFLAAVGLLTLNPMVVDGLSEARGYGMGLAFWSWGLELLLESSEQDSRQKVYLAGVCLGLSVAAALAFLAPGCALVVVYAGWGRGRGGALAGWACLTAFLLLVIPLNHAEWKTLAVGATSLRQTINELSALTFGTSSKVLAAAARVVVAVVAVVGAAAAGRWWRRDGGLVVLTGGTLAFSLVVLMLAHAWMQVAFPQGGSVYLIPLLVLSVMGSILKFRHKAAQVGFLILSVVGIGRYVMELPLGMYASGRQFAGGRKLAKTLRAAAAQKAVRIGASAGAAPILEFYKTRYRQGNWQGIGQGLSGESDFYVLVVGEGRLVGHLHVLYRDAGLTLLQAN